MAKSRAYYGIHPSSLASQEGAGIGEHHLSFYHARVGSFAHKADGNRGITSQSYQKTCTLKRASAALESVLCGSQKRDRLFVMMRSTAVSVVFPNFGLLCPPGATISPLGAPSLEEASRSLAFDIE